MRKKQRTEQAVETYIYGTAGMAKQAMRDSYETSFPTGAARGGIVELYRGLRCRSRPLVGAAFERTIA